MQYIVCMKDLRGKGIEQEGTIKFYRFNFTLDNIMDINLQARKASILQLPVAFIQNPSDISASLPSRKSINPEELEKAFAEYITRSIDNPETAEGLLQALNWAKNDDLFNTEKTRGRGTLNDKAVKLAVDKTIEVGLLAPERRAEAVALVKDANKAAIAYVKGAGQRRTAALSEMKFASPEQSAAAYAKLSPEQKKMALKNTRGYLYTDQFHLNRTDVLNITSYSTAGTLPDGQSDVAIGNINIGASYIQEMLERATNTVNESVFDIVSNVKTLTTSLNSYFAGGLKNDNKAQAAITAADTIEGKTEELRQK